MYFFFYVVTFCLSLSSSCMGALYPMINQVLSAFSSADLLKIQSIAPPAVLIQSEQDVVHQLENAKKNKEMEWVRGADICRIIILNTTGCPVWQSKGWIALGSFFRKKHYYAASLMCYDKASLLDPFSYMPFYKKARIYISFLPAHFHFQENPQFQKECFQKAVEELKTAVLLATKPADVFFLETHLADVYMEEKESIFKNLGKMQYLKAIDILKKTPCLNDHSFITRNFFTLYKIAFYLCEEPVLPDSYQFAKQIYTIFLDQLSNQDLFSFSVHQKLGTLYEKGGYGMHSNPVKAKKHLGIAQGIQELLTP